MPVLRQRLLTMTILTPIIVILLIAGGWWYASGITLVLAVAGNEFVSMMQKGGYRPYRIILVAAIVLIVVARALGLENITFGPGLSALLIVSATAMLAAYGDGDKNPAVNFGLTLGGALYIGWLGAHLVAVRQLPDGLYWSLVVIPAIAGADSGAYLVGRRFGRHQMSPVVSPHKTWEGYLGGMIVAGIVGAVCAGLASLIAPRVTLSDGVVIGLLTGLLGPIGDLAISTIKRMVGVKDSGNILPGHGGVLDRLDSVLVTVTVCFYYIVFFASMR